MNQVQINPENKKVLWTVGHGNLGFEEFVELLKHYPIDTLVDIRAYPKSTRNPHFNQELLHSELNDKGIEYHWAGRQLGGMRKLQNNSPHIGLSGSLQAYADHMGTQGFKNSASQLVRLAEKKKIVLLCAELLYTNCHRSLLSDFLTENHCRVFHIFNKNSITEHKRTQSMRLVSGEIVYNRGVLEVFV